MHVALLCSKGSVTLCTPRKSCFKRKGIDLLEIVRMAEIPEMVKSELLLILKVDSPKWPLDTVVVVCSDWRNWAAAFLPRYNSETLQSRVNDIFFPLSGGNNENLSWKRNSGCAWC